MTRTACFGTETKSRRAWRLWNGRWRHAISVHTAATDWAQIVALYDLLTRAEPSPVIELNRAVAVAMRDGPTAGLALIDAILGRGALADYHLAHSARAELC